MEAEHPTPRPETNFYILRFSGFHNAIRELSRAVASDISKHQNSLESLSPVQVPLTSNSAGLGWPWNLLFDRLPCDSEAGVLGL